MNHPILPLLEEKLSDPFSCYNRWKISPESLEDFIGISTIEQAIANLQEATEVYLEEFPQKKSFHPILTTFEVAVNA
jgi:hypothetical protein